MDNEGAIRALKHGCFSTIRVIIRLGTRLRRLIFAVVAVLFSIAIIFTPASAHAVLVRSDPADNAVLAESPQQISLYYNEPVSPEFSNARLLDSNGKELDISEIRVDSADPFHLILVTPPLADGVYSVRWRVLSEADGHFTQGLLVFAIGAQAEHSGIRSEPKKESIPLLESILRFFNFTFLTAMIGSIYISYLVIPQAGSLSGDSQTLQSTYERIHLRIGKWSRTCTLLALLSGLAFLVYQFDLVSENLPEGASALKAGWLLAFRTRWGTLWIGRMFVLFFGLWWIRFSTSHSNRVIVWISILWTFLLVLFQALSGHAAAISSAMVIAVISDALHLMAASFWMGGLLALMFGVFPEICRARTSLELLIRTSWGPFSRWAALSVGLLLATGLYNTGKQVASVDALITTLYGKALIGKVSLMLIAGAIGLLNSILLHPQLVAPLARLLRRRDAWFPLSLKHLPALVLAEISFGLLVTLGASILTSLPPARGPEFVPVTELSAGTLSQTVDDMLITLLVKPNIPGVNVFTIRAISQRRPAPYEVLRVILRMTYQDEPSGTTSTDAQEIEPGLYQLGGSYFGLPGHWLVEVAVRRKGVEDSVARFNWQVNPPANSRVVVISDKPWEKALSYLAGGWLGLLVAIVLSVRFIGFLKWATVKRASKE